MRVLAFYEDGSLEIIESAAIAAARFERIDVVSGTVTLFAEDGTPLEPAPQALDPAPAGHPALGSGTGYRLVAAQEPGRDTLALALHEVRTLASNPRFNSVEALKAALRAAGVAVDYAAVGDA